MIAKDILKKYIEYICFWNASEGAKNPPSEILQQQISSLMKAIDIFPNPDEVDSTDSYFSFFEYGDFTKRNTYNEDILTNKMQVFIDEFISQSNHADRLNQMKDDIEYDQIFSILLSFRLRIGMLFMPDGIRYEGFGSFENHFYDYQKGIVLKSLDETIKKIDEILYILIDPTQKSMDEETLIAHHDYPTKDLRSVANDWFANGF